MRLLVRTGFCVALAAVPMLFGFHAGFQAMSAETTRPADRGSPATRAEPGNTSSSSRAATPSRQRTSFSRQDEDVATIAGMPDARFWGDSEQAFLAALGPGRGPWLAISGGGEDGAFGAGLLNGWTQAGTRPDFSVVTGVSTGALIAPYVFAGSRYDAALRERFTTVSAGDVFEDGATVDSLLDTWPLRDLIARNITPELMADIAAQHRAGRRLFVLTTNLDAGRPTVWNIGAIAAYGGKRALDLIRQVLLASASVPGIFPPVAIDVEANGRNFQELHGDGAINAPLFVAPESMLDKSRLNHLPTQSVYLLMNGKLYPDFMVTPHGKLSVLSRSIGLALQGSMRGEIARVHQAAKEAGIGFNLAYIDSAFDHPSSGIFDRDYMAALFAHGLAQGKSGRPFQTDLPGPQKQTRAEQDR